MVMEDLKVGQIAVATVPVDTMVDGLTVHVTTAMRPLGPDDWVLIHKPDGSNASFFLEKKTDRGITFFWHGLRFYLVHDGGSVYHVEMEDHHKDILAIHAEHGLKNAI
jgi:hypothetical protein